MRGAAGCSLPRAAASGAPGDHRDGLEARDQGEVESSGPCVLLVTGDGGTERSLVRSLAKRCVVAELARSVAELALRLKRGDLGAPNVVFLDLELPDAAGEDWVWGVRQSFADAALVAFGASLTASRAARLLGLGVPSLRKPIAPTAFARLALELGAAQSRERPAGSAPPDSTGTGRVGGFDSTIESYASVRALSNQQRLILGFYLSGENDKQIAQTLSCSEATIYEHWRRMAKKAGGTSKSAVITDFHRFLVRN